MSSSAPPAAPSGGAALSLSQADAQRAAALRRMRFVATSLLVLAAIVFVATLEVNPIGRQRLSCIVAAGNRII